MRLCHPWQRRSRRGGFVEQRVRPDNPACHAICLVRSGQIARQARIAGQPNVRATPLARREKKNMEMNKTHSKELVAPCGVNCFNCSAFLRKKVSCPGCRSDGVNKPKHCINCSRKACAQEQGLKYCFECIKYPCEKIKRLQTTYRER